VGVVSAGVPWSYGSSGVKDVAFVLFMKQSIFPAIPTGKQSAAFYHVKRSPDGSKFVKCSGYEITCGKQALRTFKFLFGIF